jgi:flagellar FliL protein
MDAVRQHAPAIRNAYLFLMSNMRYADIATLAGKEQLRAEMREEAQAILIRNTGEPGVEEIYFTSFVVQ